MMMCLWMYIDVHATAAPLCFYCPCLLYTVFEFMCDAFRMISMNRFLYHIYTCVCSEWCLLRRIRENLYKQKKKYGGGKEVQCGTVVF